MHLSRPRQVSSCNYLPLTQILYQEEGAHSGIWEDVILYEAVVALPGKEHNFMELGVCLEG